MQLLRLGSAAQYPISFGYQEQTYQWSIIDAFMAVAREVIA